MTAFDFPSSPTPNQVYQYYTWDGEKWISTLGGIAKPATPATILTGLIGWWDASVTASLTLSGATITNAADQSGTGHHLGDGTTSGRPTYNATGLNSRPSMLFSGSQSIPATAAFPMGTGNTMTFFMVAFYNGGSGYSRAASYYTGVDSDWSNVANWCFVRGSTTSVGFQRGGTGAYKSGTSNNVPARIIGTINSSGLCTTYVDGVSGGTFTQAGNFTNNGTLHIGASVSDFGNVWSGAISEIGIATGFADATAVAALDLSLKNKWGL